MSNQKHSLYRKYRPSNWDELCGQEAVVRILRATLRSKDISHAYLLSGPRGTGKTSSAKIFAKAINCDNPQDGQACGECGPCLSFQKGNYPDFFEIDAASNRKIDDFREIKEQVQYPPLGGKGKYKIYIIDEAHMLTKEAANAFLKTLEEPPPWVVFMLATTEPEKILPTIHSRCIRLDFSLLTYEQVKSRLQVVASQESVNIEELALEKVIRHGEGGLRNILTLLERAIHFCGHEIKLENYLEMMGLAPLEQVDCLLDAFYQENKGEVIQRYRALFREGKQPQDIYLQLLDRVQNFLHFLLKIEGDFGNIPEWVLKSPVSFWTKTYAHFLDILDRMQHSFHPELHGEIGLMGVESSGSEKGNNESLPAPGVMQKVLKLEKRIKDLEKGDSSSKSAPVQKRVVSFLDRTDEPTNDTDKLWYRIKREIKRKNTILHAFVEPARMSENDNKICLTFAPEHEFHYKRIQEEKYYTALTEFLSQHLGADREFEFVLAKRNQGMQRADAPKRITDSARNVEKGSKDGFVPEELKQKLMQDEGLRQIVDELDAEIENVK
jgi:DNA polymerase-3 subunit gamma/tau